MNEEVFTYYLTTSDVRLIKSSLKAYIHLCEDILNSISDRDEHLKVETKIKELNELFINM